MCQKTRVLKMVKNSKCLIKSVPWKKLTNKEVEYVDKFMLVNRNLNDQEFKGKAHYLFINGEEKPKHWVEIIEVLMMCCSVPQ